jgi:hypothetical protein
VQYRNSTSATSKNNFCNIQHHGSENIETQHL